MVSRESLVLRQTLQDTFIPHFTGNSGRIGFDPATCRVYIHTLVPLRHDWPQTKMLIINNREIDKMHYNNFYIR